MPQPTLAPTRVDYPDSDGCPMAEGGFQFNSLTYAVMALRAHFEHREDVYVAGNMLIYDVEGDRQSSISPDVFVVFGVPTHTRSSYFLWEEAVPDFVMEIASASTVARDRVSKRDRCRLRGERILAIRPLGHASGAALAGLRAGGRRVRGAAALGACGRRGWGLQPGSGSARADVGRDVAVSRSGDGS